MNAIYRVADVLSKKQQKQTSTSVNNRFFRYIFVSMFFFILKCALQPLDRLLDSTSNLVYKVVCLK